MKKKILAIAVACLLVVTGVVALFACGKDNTAEAATRMTVDINPSVEFLLDKDNKVISVTALNDDGSILIAGEAFIGKTAEDAAELVISLATQTGYLVKGNVEASENEISISVSGNKAAAEKLYKDVKAEVEAFLTKNNVSAMVEKAEALGVAALRELVKKVNPALTQEELAAMNEQQLLNELRIARIETAELLTDAMRDAYASFKAYEVSFAGHEKTGEIIDRADGAYQSVKAAYEKLLDSYEDIIESIEKARYDYLVSPESAYQQKVAELLDAKAALVAQNNVVAQMADGLEKTLAEATLALKEQAYNAGVTALELAGSTANATIDAMVATMRSIEDQLIAFKDTLPQEIKTSLTENVKSMETAINHAKADALREFEDEYGADIKAMLDALKARKEAMIAANK